VWCGVVWCGVVWCGVWASGGNKRDEDEAHLPDALVHAVDLHHLVHDLRHAPQVVGRARRHAAEKHLLGDSGTDTDRGADRA